MPVPDFAKKKEDVVKDCFTYCETNKVEALGEASILPIQKAE